LPLIRIAPGRDGVSIWSPSLFGEPDVRRFLAQVFSVPEVAAVELRRRDDYGRIHYEHSDQASRIWQKLSRALKIFDDEGAALGAGGLYLGAALGERIRVNRIADTLTTWQLQSQDGPRLRLSHRLLRRRRGLAYRLEEELSRLFGVAAASANVATGSVAIRFDPEVVSVDQLVRRLEKSWPVVLGGTRAPPSNKRLVLVSGLLGLAAAGEFFVPAIRPWAVAGVTLNSLPNVINGSRQLAHWQVGLPALYSVGLGFMLWTGMPFNATIFAVLMQLWPKVSFQLLTKHQRALFADYRHQVLSARRLGQDGRITAVDADTLAPGDMVVVARGETIPADGVVTGGLAVVNEAMLSAAADVEDKRPGDLVYANTRVRDGELTIRVERPGGRTIAWEIAAVLPQGTIPSLPSAARAEEIANRNAQPAIALAGLSLLLSRTIRPSQAIIRPDYATAPRLSAQLTALLGLGRGLANGIVFRDPAKLDRLTEADIYVFDNTSDVARPGLSVAAVITAGDLPAERVLGYAAAAYPGAASARGNALRLESARRAAPVPAIEQYGREAGVIRCVAADGEAFSVATQAATGHADIPAALWRASQRHQGAEAEPLWVRLDGKVAGVVILHRHGAPEAGEALAALKARHKAARFMYLSSEAEAKAEEIAAAAGISTVFGGLSADGKVEILAKLGTRAVWVGNGAAPEVLPYIKASQLSISTAGMPTMGQDAADVVLLQPGLHALVPLARIGEAHRGHLRADYRVVYAANLLGAAGGLVANLGGREAGLISNAGTAVVFGRRWAQLRGLAKQMERRKQAALF